jgi:hypothetical protein
VSTLPTTKELRKRIEKSINDFNKDWSYPVSLFFHKDVIDKMKNSFDETDFQKCLALMKANEEKGTTYIVPKFIPNAEEFVKKMESEKKNPNVHYKLSK